MSDPSFACISSKMALMLLSFAAFFVTASATTVLRVQKIINANFAKNRQKFKYYDDAFRNTAQPLYAKGKISKKQESLIVQLGGKDNNEIWDMSGAWGRTFNLNTEVDVQIMFELRMLLSSGMDEGDDLDAMLSIDGKAIGSGPGKDFITRLRGKDGKKKQDTGYKTVTINVGRLAKGTHTLLIGGFLTTKDAKNEFGRIYIRNVMVTTGNFPAGPTTTSPTGAPSMTVTFEPTESPTEVVTKRPTRAPVPRQTKAPTAAPTERPTQAPVQPLPTKIFNADFESDTNGFSYMDDLFQNTRNPRYASGSLINNRLVITLGAVSDENVDGMSGAWKRNFVLARPARNVQIMFDYFVTLSTGTDAGEFCQALAVVADRNLDAIVTLLADGRNVAHTTGIRKYTANVGARDSGQYEIRLGGFLNRKNSADERCDVSYDNVMILVDYVPTPRPTPAPTNRPTFQRTPAPTTRPASAPTPSPTRSPTLLPTRAPTPSPTRAPRKTTGFQKAKTSCARAVAIPVHFGGLSDVFLVTVVAHASLGTILRSGNHFMYTARQGAAGRDRFIYSVNSRNGDMHRVTVTIHITCVLHY